jgi:hypothetical protein
MRKFLTLCALITVLAAPLFAQTHTTVTLEDTQTITGNKTVNTLIANSLNNVCNVTSAQSLSTCITNIGSSGTIAITSSVGTVSGTGLTIPAGVALRVDQGALISGTPTINGTIVEGPHQIFAAGTAPVLGGQQPWIYPQWWGAANNNSTDDTAAIQSAIAAACSSGTKGGTIKFPGGSGYKSANTSTSPITLSCDGLAFEGAGYNTQNAPTVPPSRILCPACTVPLITDGGTQRYGFQVHYLGFSGNAGSETSTGISLGKVGDYTIEDNFFDQFGGSAIVTTGGFGGTLRHNFAQNCLMQRPAGTDTGCFDIGNNDTTAEANFVTTSVGTATGNIGTGHAYAWVIRGANGFFLMNMAEISQHGWLVNGSLNTLVGNRSFLIQGNGLVVNGNQNIISSHKAIDVSQTASGSYDCFVFTSSETFGGNILNDAQCEMDRSGNGSSVRNAVTDNNNAGTADINANRYNNLRWRSNLGTGAKISFTGSASVVVDNHRASSDRGNNSITLTCGLDPETEPFLTALTANQTVTFSNTGAYAGCRFRVVRTEAATGPYNITTSTGGNNCTLTAPNQYADAEFIQGVWRITGCMFGLSTTGSGTTVMLNGSPTIAGTVPSYNSISTAGQGLSVIQCVTSQKSESAADSNVLTCATPAAAGSYRLRFVLSVSAASSATLGWTATWKDSNSASAAPANLPICSGSAGTCAANTGAISAAGQYSGDFQIDTDNGATSIVIKLTFSGTSFTGKASAIVERII